MTDVYILKILPLNEHVKMMYPNSNHSTASLYGSVPKNRDSGIDIHFPVDITVPANAKSFSIGLGVKCEMIHYHRDYSGGLRGVSGSGYWLLPRSSISKTPLRMSNSVGVIDQDYRGELIAKVDNNSDEDYHIEAGTRLFQILNPLMSPMDYRIIDELSETVRGEGGFGSTGQ